MKKTIGNILLKNLKKLIVLKTVFTKYYFQWLIIPISKNILKI